MRYCKGIELINVALGKYNTALRDPATTPAQAAEYRKNAPGEARGRREDVRERRIGSIGVLGRSGGGFIELADVDLGANRAEPGDTSARDLAGPSSVVRPAPHVDARLVVGNEHVLAQ